MAATDIRQALDEIEWALFNVRDLTDALASAKQLVRKFPLLPATHIVLHRVVCYGDFDGGARSSLRYCQAVQKLPAYLADGTVLRIIMLCDRAAGYIVQTNRDVAKASSLLDEATLLAQGARSSETVDLRLHHAKGQLEFAAGRYEKAFEEHRAAYHSTVFRPTWSRQRVLMLRALVAQEGRNGPRARKLYANLMDGGLWEGENPQLVQMLMMRDGVHRFREFEGNRR